MATDRLRIAGLRPESIVDGPGIRFVVFVQGCPHHCPGCHNPDSLPFDRGSQVGADELIAKIESNPMISGVTLSGGEPFEQADGLVQLAKAVKAMGLELAAYTGYTFEALWVRSMTDSGVASLLHTADILVDGPYIAAQRSLSLRFRGSRNQRIIHLPSSRKAGCAILDTSERWNGPTSR